VAEEHAAAALELLRDAGETAFHIVHVRTQQTGEAPTIVV
jgi:phosphoribosylformylglycinamidine cyclo-ligase